MKRHPSQTELLAYVESLVDAGSPISAKTASHVSLCASCQVAVRAIRASLEFASKAPALEPSKDLTQQILIAAQSERLAARQKPRNMRAAAMAVAKGTAFAAGLALVCAACFSLALRESLPAAGVVASAPQAAVASSVPSPEAIRKASDTVRALSAAIGAPSGKPQGLWEREYRRQIQARDADISRALKALQQNPGCVRASYLLSANLQRQAETLRKLYVERSL